MKKLALLFGLLLMTQSFAFADEIINSKGEITPCKIETVSAGFIEYTKERCIYSFTRDMNQPVFNDYVDIKTNKMFKDEVLVRYSGKIIVKDFGGVKITTQNGLMDIPASRIKFVGIYNPE